MFLSTEDAKVIHEHALRVLETTGVSMGNSEGRELLLNAGAVEKGDRIIIPRGLVEELLNLSIPEIQIYDRNGNLAMLLEADGKVHFGSGSDALYQIDLDTEERRFSTLKDIERNSRIIDKLDMFDFVMSTGLPQPGEVEEGKLYSTVFKAMTDNTSKPIITTLTALSDLQQIHQISKEVTGEGEVVEKPFFIAYVEPISPLIMDNEGVSRLLYCAEYGIPFCYAAGANCGSGAPVTLEGGIIQGTAEFLGGYVVAKLKNPKALIIYGANTSAVNPKTMLVRYGCPEWFKTVAVYADMGRFYNMPSWGTGGSSDALELNPQAAWEAQQGISACLESGVSIAHDVAYFDHGKTYDPRMLVLANEMIKKERFLRKPLNLSEEFLSESEKVINEVALGNSYYPAHMHTAMNLRDSLYIYPKNFKVDKNYKESLKEEIERLLA